MEGQIILPEYYLCDCGKKMRIVENDKDFAVLICPSCGNKKTVPIKK